MSRACIHPIKNKVTFHNFLFWLNYQPIIIQVTLPPFPMDFLYKEPSPTTFYLSFNTSKMSTPQDSIPTVFAPYSEEARLHLKQQGYVVYSAFTPTQIEVAKGKFHQFYAQFGSRSIDAPHGIIKSYGIGQSEFMWYCREQQSIINIFGDIWDTIDPDLVTSFDGACYFPKGQSHRKLFPHRDQDPRWSSLQCYQGVLQLDTSFGPENAAFVVYPQSHKIVQFDSIPFQKHCTANTTIKHWYRQEIPIQPLRLSVPAGSFIVWDSRTFHCNQSPAKESTNHRLCAYISMLPHPRSQFPTFPQSYISVWQKKRLHLYNTNRTTSHWPYSQGARSLRIAVNPDTRSYHSSAEFDPKPFVPTLPQPTTPTQDRLFLIQ
jgi:hypothetical protein